MSEVVEVNRVEQLEDYRLTFSSLLSQTRGGSFFQTVDWLSNYFRRHAGQRMRVLLVSSHGRPIGILPLTVIDQPARLGTVRVLAYPTVPPHCFSGPLGPNPTATLSAALGHLARTPRDWDVLELESNARIDRSRTARAMQAAGFQAKQNVVRHVATVDTSGTWIGFLGKLPSALSDSLRHCENTLQQFGNVVAQRLRPLGISHGDNDSHWREFEQCLDLLRRNNLKKPARVALSGDGTNLESIRQCHAMAARRGMLDLFLIRLRGRVVAFAYGYHFRNAVCILHAGVDARMAVSGIDQLLYFNLLRDSFQRGDACVYLGAADCFIHRQWASELIDVCRYTHYPSGTARAQLLRLKRWWFARRTAV